MKPLVFRLWLDKRGGDYYEARLYPSLARMRADYRVQDRTDHRGRATLNQRTLMNTNAMSCWRNYWFRRPGVRRHRMRLRGYLYFSIRTAGSGTVTHECVHAAAQWLQYDRRADIRVGHGGHERLAHVAGRLVAQYWACWYRAKEAGRIRARRIC